MAILETPADKFEYRVQKLLRLLGFDHVDGGRECLIGGRQVDAVGVFDGDLFIFECTTQQMNHEFKIAQHSLVRTPKISAALSKMSQESVANIRKEVSRTIRESENRYKKYINRGGKIYWIYAVSNNSLKVTDIQLARDNNIYTLSLDEIKYFEGLARDLPTRAGYELMAHLNIPAPKNLSIKVPAFKFEFNNLKIYQFFARPSEIVKISSVARREVNAKDYYQRMITPARLKDIHRYVNQGNFIPTNVVIAVDGKVNFNPIHSTVDFNQLSKKNNIETGILSLPADYSTCLIIDGQHRLFSFDDNDVAPLSFVAFENISMPEQMKYFVDINDNAKKIDTSLMWDLWSELRPDDKVGITSKAAKALNTKGVLKEKIKFQGSGEGKIALREVCDAIMKTSLSDKQLKNPIKGSVENPLYSPESDKFANNIATRIESFIKSVTDKTGESGRAFALSQGGIHVLINALGLILWEKKMGRINEQAEHYATVVGRGLHQAGDIKVDEWRRRASTGGYAGKDEVLGLIIGILVNEDIVFSDYKNENNHELLELRAETETTLINFILKFIKRHDPELIKKYIGEKRFNHARYLCGENLNFKNLLTKTYYLDKIEIFLKVLEEGGIELQANFVRVHDEEVSSSDRRFMNQKDLRFTLDRLSEYRNRDADIHSQLEFENLTNDEKQDAIRWYERLITCLKNSLETRVSS